MAHAEVVAGETFVALNQTTNTTANCSEELTRRPESRDPRRKLSPFG